MTTILYAKSLEINKIITAGEADYEREQGRIKSKHLFKCIDDNCNAQITCGNLLNPKSQRKREPYYTCVGEHSDKCLEKQKIEVRDKKNQETRDRKPRSYLSANVVFLNVDMPTNTKIVNNEASPTQEGNGRNNSNDKKNDNERSTNSKRPPKLLISTLVQQFKKNVDLSIAFDDEEIHIKNFFVNLDAIKNIDELEDEPRIYYGRVWVNEYEDGFQFKFINPIQVGEEAFRPSLKVFSNKIKNESENARFSVNTLNKIANGHVEKQTKKRIITLFVFSALPPQLNFTGEYLNFHIPQISYIYYSPLKL